MALTYLIKVLVRKETEKATNEVLAGHDPFAFHLFAGIFVEDFAELVRRCPLEI